MKNKTLIALLLAGVISLAACGDPASEVSKAVEAEPPESALGGGVEDMTGITFRTIFFDFTVLSAGRADSYAGYTPAEGYMLVDVLIQTTNTFGADIVMVDFDFELQWGDQDDPSTFTYPLDALDGSMAPLEYTLADGETMEYHYIYEVPADGSDWQLAYQEMYVTAEGEECFGSIYFVPLDLG